MKIHQPTELIEDPNEALQMLKDGNERFLKGELIQKTFCCADLEALCSCQKPFAIILTCSDSRVSPEIFFDQKLGDLFIIRNAGNIADETALGSIEFAVEYLMCRLIVVCGHSNCGAVMASCSNHDFPPNMKHIIDYIKPAVKKDINLEEIIINNVINEIERIKADEIVKKHSDILITGAFYDLHSGRVSWL